MKTSTTSKTLAAILVFLTLTLSNATQSDWLNTHNSGGINPDNSFHHAVDNQGNTYVTGYGAPGGYPNGLLIKLSPTGSLVWSKTFYGYNGGNAMGKKILTDQNNNVYVFSEGASYGNSWDFWLNKFDANGNNIFSVRYGEPAYNESFGDAIFDYSGNIVVAVSGRTYADSLYNINLIKYNSSGIPILFHTYNAPDGNAYAQKLLLDISGNIFMAGSIVYPFQPVHALVILRKYNSQFQSLAGNTIGGGINTITILGDAELMLNTDLIVSCSLPRPSGEKDLTVVKFNNFLNTIWAKDFNIVNGQDEIVPDMIIDGNNNIYITGNSDANGIHANAITVKLNIDGNMIWNRVYDRNGYHDEAKRIGLDNFGNVYCGGVSSVSQNMDAMIIKYDANGNQQFVYNYNGLGNSTDIINFMTVSHTGLITANGFTTNNTSTDFFTISLTGHLTGITGNNSEIPESFNLSQNYPNPFNPSTKISFSLPQASFVKMVVYDITGREVETLVNEDMNAGTFEVDFNASKLTSGVYFYKITADGFTETKKMILTK
jgi:hypothetical protein